MQQRPFRHSSLNICSSVFGPTRFRGFDTAAVTCETSSLVIMLVSNVIVIDPLADAAWKAARSSTATPLTWEHFRSLKRINAGVLFHRAQEVYPLSPVLGGGHPKEGWIACGANRNN
eukprot:gene5182-biopygen3264